MKNFEKFRGKELTRAELANVKGQGGPQCPGDYAACNANCGHFSSSYGTFASCVDTISNHQCSPLSGWYTECGDYN